MVKIKDNVDLKELEKFGFEYNDNIGKYTRYKTGNLCISLVVRAWDRKIYINAAEVTFDTELPDLLHDLFLNKLIEKVSD